MMLFRRPESSRAEAFFDGGVSFICGNMLEILRQFPDNYFSSCVTDPPYHLQSIVKRFAKSGRTESTRTKSGPHQRTAEGFMGKMWDGGDIAFRVETWAEVLRVIKPGAYILAFSSSRTYHRMACAIEDAGFITHPMQGWIFGSGFPKAHAVENDCWLGWSYGAQSTKPALEPIYMGQKPFTGITGTANVLRWGVGAINVDGCRVGDDVRVAAYTSFAPCHGNQLEAPGTQEARRGTQSKPKKYVGRWPANIITDGSDEVSAEFPNSRGQIARARTDDVAQGNSVYGPLNHVTTNPDPRNDSGSAARFFYAAKASASERLGSKHPTVKPLALLRYLVRLVTPKDGLVLDPFAGSGTTGEAAVAEGSSAVLIDLNEETADDLAARENR